MDDLDRAQELEIETRNAAIANQRRKQSTISHSHCVECGDAIPKARQMFGGVSRCVACQQYFEKKEKSYGR